MNRLRSEPKTHPSVFITLMFAALTIAGGGIMQAICKNSQIQTERLIDQAETRIDQTRVKIRMVEVNTDELLDRFDMQERLKEAGSKLIPLSPADIEEVGPGLPAPEVASISDPP